MTRPAIRNTVSLSAYKYSTCRECGKRIMRRHTFYASSFASAHAQREAWMRVTNEICQECAK